MDDRSAGFRPFVAPESSIPEFTFRALLLGMVLAVVMTAANTYLGLYAGMTVSASIPAAVISMGLLRGVLRRGTILENNIVQTIASTGESLAAGIIFTVPALVITGVWQTFDYWKVTWIAILGGVLGVLFMVPIRRALIVRSDRELVYPEGVACAEVLEAGERGGRDIRLIMKGLGAGALFKFLIASMKLFPGTLQKAARVGRTCLYGGIDLSPALLSVGYIVGIQVAALVFMGGALAWCVALPVLSNLIEVAAEAPADIAEALWRDHIRYMGVGAMLVGGLWSIVSVRRGIRRGVSAVLGSEGAREDLRTERDMAPGETVPLLVLAAAAVFGLYWTLTASPGKSAVLTCMMIAAAFFFVAVSSYIVGLVGSSNNPVSGMTITTMLFASGLLVLFGFESDEGILAALGIAGVVCCAACTAGDISQDLKTGYLVGATPRAQQWAELLGAAIPAFVIAPVLILLQNAQGIGVPASAAHPDPLPAPQANLFASIATAFFREGAIPWTMVGIGAGVGCLLVTVNEILKASGSRLRTHCMPVAVGIYLPFTLSVPIFLGGILRHVVERARTDEAERKRASHRGMLLASGLIAGEAVMGIAVAVLVTLEISFTWPEVGSAAALGLVAWWVWKTCRPSPDDAAP